MGRKAPRRLFGRLQTVQRRRNISVPQKALSNLKRRYVGILCDYYTYDGEYDGVYSYGDKIVVNGDITVGYEYVGEYDTNICYELTDIYNNSITTEMIEVEMN